MKITDYKIVSEDSANNLEKQVQELIKLGWLPIGGINTSIFTDNNNMEHSTISQAMIKQE
ncbi:MAG TPA: DUF1737 domain-containing protein [Draconibacterium sp.]|nr:DUF1737 domain-containing protein [Draconibacterium sp.]